MTEMILSDPSAAAGVDPDLVAFIYHEARLADEARYSEWEALWDDDGTYWVPMSPDADPETQVSYINDNRARIRSRVRRVVLSASRHQSGRARLPAHAGSGCAVVTGACARPW